MQGTRRRAAATAAAAPRTTLFVSAREDTGISRSRNDAAGVVGRLLEVGSCERDGTRTPPAKAEARRGRMLVAGRRPRSAEHPAPRRCALPMCACKCLPGESRGRRRAESREYSILDREVQVGPGPGPTESPHSLAPGHVPSARGVIRVLRWTQIGPKGVPFFAVDCRERQ
jgi:hypothetical protein